MLQVHPEAKDYRTETLRHYPKLRTLFLGTGACGRAAIDIHTLVSSGASAAQPPTSAVEITSSDGEASDGDVGDHEGTSGQDGVDEKKEVPENKEDRKIAFPEKKEREI